MSCGLCKILIANNKKKWRIEKKLKMEHKVGKIHSILIYKTV